MMSEPSAPSAHAKSPQSKTEDKLSGLDNGQNVGRTLELVTNLGVSAFTIDAIV